MSDLFDDTNIPSEDKIDRVIDNSSIPFVQVPKFLLDQYGRELGVSGLAVYCVLRYHADWVSMTTFLLEETIAEMVDMGESTVRREISKLEKMGILKKTTRYGKSNIYELLDIRHLITKKTDLLPNSEHLLPDSKLLLPNSTISRSSSSRGSVSRKKQNQSLTLPDWLPLEQWNAYLEMRQSIKKPLTDVAKKLAISLLDKLRGEGHDPKLVIEQSVFHSWMGLFPLKENGHTTNGSRWTCKKCGKDWTPDHAC